MDPSAPIIGAKKIAYTIGPFHNSQVIDMSNVVVKMKLRLVKYNNNGKIVMPAG